MSADGATALGIDPVGLAVIEALARRAAAQQGEARRLMLLRVEELLAQHAAARPHAGQAANVPDELGARRVVLAGLSELVDRLGRSTTSRPPPAPPRKGVARHNDALKTAPLSRAASPASSNAVTAFKSTWSRLRADQRLRQALAQVPAMAGPLNSSHVMNRTLQAMRELSPEYLDAFMLHIDTLLWLEQASGASDNPLRAATPAEGGRGPGARAGRKA